MHLVVAATVVFVIGCPSNDPVENEGNKPDDQNVDQQIRNQEDFAKWLPSTVWRKKNQTESIEFLNANEYLYRNTVTDEQSIHTYTISNEFRKLTLHWKMDDFDAACIFNEDFSEFLEVERFTWSREE